jgi:dTDP-4-amino-4,6-dideoxygalactose transaminase
MSAAPIVYLGATPIFVDSAPDRVDFDYDDLARKLSPRSKAIIAVHLWGCSCDLPRLMQFARARGIAVIEDACQAHGSTIAGRLLGTWGDLGCFSLKDGKLLATGEGGFVLTDDPNHAGKCRLLRTHCATPNEPETSYRRLGWNYRLTEYQAGLLEVQLPLFHEIVAFRQSQSNYLGEALADVEQLQAYEYLGIEQSNYFSPLWFLDSSRGRQFARVLARRGVPNSTGTFGLKPCQFWGAFGNAKRDSFGDETPNASALLDRSLAILLQISHGPAELQRTAATIREVLRGN